MEPMNDGFSCLWRMGGCTPTGFITGFMGIVIAIILYGTPYQSSDCLLERISSHWRAKFRLESLATKFGTWWRNSWQRWGKQRFFDLMATNQWIWNGFWELMMQRWRLNFWGSSSSSSPEYIWPVLLNEESPYWSPDPKAAHSHSLGFQGTCAGTGICRSPCPLPHGVDNRARGTAFFSSMFHGDRTKLSIFSYFGGLKYLLYFQVTNTFFWGVEAT